jgi:DNA-binding transcriptional MerR regulator
LIEEPTNPRSGSPLFSQEALRRILLIKEVRQLGFTLAETRELLAQDDEPYGAAKSIAERKIAALRSTLAELRQKERALEQLLAHCPPRKER